MKGFATEYTHIHRIVIVSTDRATAMQHQFKDGSAQDPTMLGLDIFASDDMERPRAWLRTVLCPTLVDRQYLENRGFKTSFIQRFNKKHSRVLRFDGTVARGVRGINEMELLRGVADALGVRPFEEEWDPRDTVTTMAVAQKCLDALTAIESRRPTDSSMHAPGGGAEMPAMDTGVCS